MTEENNNCYYSRNYIPYNINNGLSDLNALGTNTDSLAQNIYISDVSYMRQNTNQNVHNMNNLNLIQVLTEMKKEMQELKTKENNYNIQMSKMNKEIQEFKTKENNNNIQRLKMIKEIQELKTKENNYNIQMFKMIQEIQELKTKENNYNIQMFKMLKEIQELKTKENNYNIQMFKMIQKFKTKENNLNTQIDIIKNDKKALNEKFEGMKIEMNNLRAFDERIIKKFNEMDEAVKSINIPLINNENLSKQIELLKQKLKFLEENLCQLKNDVNEKNQNNIKEISRLKKEIQELKERINELQNLFVGRKLIKIILKIIIEYCFQNYSATGTTINVQRLKNEKYVPYKKIANNLIEIILKKNKIIHIDGEINKIIDIINDKTTYGDILNLVKDSLKQNDFQNILDLLKENLLLNEICKDDIIGTDQDLYDIINKPKNSE